MNPPTISATEKRINELELEMKHPLPTPPVGTPVVWYDRAQVSEEAQRAAIVTRVEGPGKVTLTIFPPNGMPLYNKKGTLHVSHEIHDRRGNAVSKNSGSWDYTSRTSRPKSHNELHIAEIQKKIDSLEAQLDDVREMVSQKGAV
jgi:hypothetical protein